MLKQQPVADNDDTSRKLVFQRFDSGLHIALGLRQIIQIYPRFVFLIN